MTTKNETYLNFLSEEILTLNRYNTKLTHVSILVLFGMSSNIL